MHLKWGWFSIESATAFCRLKSHVLVDCQVAMSTPQDWVDGRTIHTLTLTQLDEFDNAEHSNGNSLSIWMDQHHCCASTQIQVCQFTAWGPELLDLKSSELFFWFCLELSQRQLLCVAESCQDLDVIFPVCLTSSSRSWHMQLSWFGDTSNAQWLHQYNFEALADECTVTVYNLPPWGEWRLQSRYIWAVD